VKKYNTSRLDAVVKKGKREREKCTVVECDGKKTSDTWRLVIARVKSHKLAISSLEDHLSTPSFAPTHRMDSLQGTSWDVLIAGTGIQESLLALSVPP